GGVGDAGDGLGERDVSGERHALDELGIVPDRADRVRQQLSLRLHRSEHLEAGGMEQLLMPPQGGKRTPLTRGLTPSYTWGQQGLEAQFRDVFQPDLGIFSPGYPLAPLDPEELRVWDFPVGANTIYTPRAYEAVSFEELRALADGHDITRLAIE